MKNSKTLKAGPSKQHYINTFYNFCAYGESQFLPFSLFPLSLFLFLSYNLEGKHSQKSLNHSLARTVSHVYTELQGKLGKWPPDQVSASGSQKWGHARLRRGGTILQKLAPKIILCIYKKSLALQESVSNTPSSMRSFLTSKPGIIFSFFGILYKTVETDKKNQPWDDQITSTEEY